jgi:glycosyltransferase involved in cell wall biosynthesis
MNPVAELPNDEDRVDCSVLVPILNEEQYIAETIEAMRGQRFGGRLEFLLVDGRSSDRTRELIAELQREDPRIRLLDNPRGGTPSGLNVALAHARGRWVARMDGHTRYPDNYIALGVQRLAGGDTRWVSGPQIASGDGTVSRAVALALRTPLGRGGSRKWAAERDPSGQGYELDSGVFAGVWERSTVLEFGGWDERWLRNQDSEMAGRFLARGERLICVPAMGAHYTPRNTISSLWRQYREYGEYRALTALRHPRTMRRSHLLAPALVASVLASVSPPVRVRRVARGGLLVYGAAVAGAAVRVAPAATEPADAILVPAVLATMHLAHGAGAWLGAFRHGPPLAALAWALGLRRLAARLSPAPEPVFAPSLQAAGDGIKP